MIQVSIVLDAIFGCKRRQPPKEDLPVCLLDYSVPIPVVWELSISIASSFRFFFTTAQEQLNLASGKAVDFGTLLVSAGNTAADVCVIPIHTRKRSSYLFRGVQLVILNTNRGITSNCDDKLKVKKQNKKKTTKTTF